MKAYKKIVFSLLFFAFASQVARAQRPDGFDMKKAYQDAQEKGIPQSDVEGYVRYLHQDYRSHGQGHNHSSEVLDLGTIYRGYTNTPSSVARMAAIPNSPQNSYCPNAGFEQLNFTNWTGSTGTVVTAPSGAPSPFYAQTGSSIVNGAGNDASLVNTLNYHTITTVPAINNVYPNCVGYDSIACKVIGTQTVSEIPVVNPLGGPSSVRLNGALANYRACKVSYQMALNPNNKSFTISYALVLENGGHFAYEQPYFSVKITDQNGTPVPGCSVYTVTCNANLTNSASSIYDPTWSDSEVGYDVMYRKWSTYAFDLSNYPTITSINVEFYVGGCSQSGHYGYAYVDAECSQGGAVASFCAGSNTSVLTAPAGYVTYQWVGPSGSVSASNGGNTTTATITPVTAGQVFTCNVTAQNGCFSSFQTTVSVTTVSITGVNSTPSCPNGNSGTANVSATGSSLGYSYQWLNSSGTTVSSVRNATGLAPGTYSVIVSSPMCGSNTTTVSVGIAPPIHYGLNAPFCGTVAWIIKPGGTNYKWYTASPLALIAGANTESLTITSPVDGNQYFLVYETASGCKDSIKYTLTQTPGGSIFVSNIKSICPGNTNSYAIVNLQTSATPAYSYSVTGAGGYSSVLSNTSLLKDSVINLSIGSYSVTVFDGECLYNTTFTVNPFAYTYTVTPTTTTICNTGTTTLSVNFSNTPPSSCGLSATGGCSSPSQVTIGTGNSVNTSYSFPCIYGHYYRNARHQLLYTATELTAMGVIPGKISSAAFMVNSIPSGYTGTLPGLTIKMKCTQQNDFSLSWDFDNTGLVQVYSSNYTPVVGWNQHTFSSGYEWDGSSNILVDICYTFNAGVMYTTNPMMPSTTTSIERCMYDRSDYDPLCGSSSYPTSTTTRPNIRFGNCGVSNPSLFSYTWTPNTNIAPVNTYTAIANPLTTTIYTVEVEPIGQTNCMQAQSATITVIIPVTPTITPVNPLCTNATQFTLDVNPLGGTWNGSGVVASGLFTPSLSLPGNNTYTYTVGSGSCIATGTTSIAVTKFIPATITGTMGPYCIYHPAEDLQPAAQYVGGVWTGNGVSGSFFTPAVAGAGIHSVIYSTDPAPSGLCPDQAFIDIQVNDKPEVNALTDKTDGCNPVMINLYTTTTTTGTATWDFGDGSPVGSGLTTNHLYTTPGTYTAAITYTDGIGCIDTTYILTAITDYSVPVASFEPSLMETTVVDGQLSFANQSTVLNANTYQWDIGGLATSDSVNTSYFFAHSGNYAITLVATNSYGCVDDTTIIVKVNPDVVLYVPNAFTPGNGDGKNDVFEISLPPTGVDYSTFNLTIYDRWGEVIYKTNDVNKSWNGSKNNSGSVLKQETYVWKITFYDEQRKYYERLGHVSLIR